jgi:Amidohydrolase family
VDSGAVASRGGGPSGAAILTGGIDFDEAKSSFWSTSGPVALRKASGGPAVPHLVKRQTSETADFFGLSDRGRLLPGLRADVNIIDFDRLRLHKPELVHDMPASGRRFVQRVDGYEATLAAGIPIFERGEHTGAMPGRLVRAGYNGRRAALKDTGYGSQARRKDRLDYRRLQGNRRGDRHTIGG